MIEQGGWLPIETAPKDGTEILVIGVYDNGMPWAGSQFSNWHANGWNSGWLDLRDDEEVYFQNVTHWMPIPPYPTVEPT